MCAWLLAWLSSPPKPLPARTFLTTQATSAHAWVGLPRIPAKPHALKPGKKIDSDKLTCY